MNWITAVAFAQDAAAQTAAQPKPSIVEMLVLPVGLMVVLYFFTIRPQQKRAREHSDLLKNIKVGDEVVTSGGVIGKVRSVAETFVSLEVSQNSTIKVLKSAVTGTTKQLEKPAPAAKEQPAKA